jgi:sodium transport system permease protein
MRWSIIRLIWLRELRDQLRDRRTVFMMAVLPILLYPLVGIGLMQFAVGFLKQSNVVGVIGAENLPPATPRSALLSPLPATAWFALTPGSGVDQAIAAAGLAHAAQRGVGQDYPPLILIESGDARFPSWYFDSSREANALTVKLLPPIDLPPGSADRPDRDEDEDEDADAFLAHIDRSALDAKKVDLLLIVPPDFQAKLERGDRPTVYVLTREKDERSRLVNARVHSVLARWKKRVKEMRLLRQGLPSDFDDTLEVRDPERYRSSAKFAARDLFDTLVRIFPFMLVMWSLAGALYPAVDLCAGEKERGTMETLLISPVGREEIVWGKFLAIWSFSAATALLNLLSMTLTAWNFRDMLPYDALRVTGIIWCIVLMLPLSAFFSALCLAVGAYARSSKEGQYYLMPLFLITMPLIFLTLAPGVDLNPFYSMVPVTGVALLMQKLMTTGPEQIPWLYFIPVLGPLALYGWFALRWAIEQFNREEVLFREAERLDVSLWLRHMFRDKETLPSLGQALFCFGLVAVLRWLAFGMGGDLSVLARTSIEMFAFVATPPILMALLLTTQPTTGLSLRRPTLRQAAVGLALALLFVPPLAETRTLILRQFPGLLQIMNEHHPLAEFLQGYHGEATKLTAAWPLLLVFVVVLPVCEELAFRGFILSGLQRQFSPWKAVLLSSFLFALYHMNVFQFIPAFLLGVVLGLMAARTRSIWPGVLMHALHNGLFLGSLFLEPLLRTLGFEGEDLPGLDVLRWIVCAVCVPPAFYVLWRLGSGLSDKREVLPTVAPTTPVPILVNGAATSPFRGNAELSEVSLDSRSAPKTPRRS